MLQFDPTVIQTHVQRLYDTANFVVALYTIFGLLGGAMIGFGFANMNNMNEEGVVSLVVGLVIAALAFAVGQSKAFTMRLEAQTALCQLQIEGNTRAAAQAMGFIASRMAGPH
jgi:hypothetical protein